ncbi:MAG: serine protease [Pseudomonadota bacterium]
MCRKQNAHAIALLGFLAIVASAAGQSTVAADECEIGTRVNGLDIIRHIGGHELSGYSARTRKDWVERLHRGGRTEFQAVGGKLSEGLWRVEGDQLCFSYGTLTEWSCKAVHKAKGACEGLEYVFVDDAGKVTSGILSVRKIDRQGVAQAGPKPQQNDESGWSEAKRRDVQDALLWAGYYFGLIDGDFGTGTRKAIRSFQTDQGLTVTGFLTDAQVDRLYVLRNNAVSDSGFQVSDDQRTGIRIGLPQALVRYQDTDGGMHIYENRPGTPWSELALVSFAAGQGDLKTLYGSIVGQEQADVDKYAVLKDDWFVVSFTRDGIARYAHVRLADGLMKGFILRWGSNDTDKFQRIAAAMYNSFDPIPGGGAAIGGIAQGGSDADGSSGGKAGGKAGDGRIARAPEAEGKAGDGRASQSGGKSADGSAPRQQFDREPASTGTGFVVDRQGRILTNAHVIDGCRSIAVADGIPATVRRRDDNADLALVEPQGGQWPIIATFAPSNARLNADVTVIGYPLHGLLGGLNVTRGSVSALSGLHADELQFQITAAVQPGNSGGPVIDNSGAVLGVVQSKLDAVKLAESIGDIPQNINFAIRGDVAKKFLYKAGVRFQTAGSAAALNPADLADEARKFTVLVSCYD